MNYSIQSLGYGLLSMLLVVAVAALCTAVKSALKKHLRKTKRSPHPDGRK
jgi:hypothetical protein